ncbi:hypothetical protein F4782DRAFT_515147 [Xylaria castorea]|nr:hypothetical protein F4782DRAFT_515147 [Xylaria castorea]
MKFPATIAVYAAFITKCVSALQAVIANSCKSTVYNQPFPYYGNSAGTQATVTPEDRLPMATERPVPYVSSHPHIV